LGERTFTKKRKRQGKKRKKKAERGSDTHKKIDRQQRVTPAKQSCFITTAMIKKSQRSVRKSRKQTRSISLKRGTLGGITILKRTIKPWGGSAIKQLVKRQNGSEVQERFCTRKTTISKGFQNQVKANRDTPEQPFQNKKKKGNDIK